MAVTNGKKAVAVDDFNNWPNAVGFETLYEQKTPVELQVQGNIPNYAAGVLYRQGPRSYQVDGTPHGTFKLSHWFDCFQETHRFELAPSASGMKVRYNSRLACDILLQEIEKTGKWASFTFGQKRDPCVGLFGKVTSSFHAAVAETRKDVAKETPSSENVQVTLKINHPGLPTTAGTIGAKGLHEALATGEIFKPGQSSEIQSLYSTTDGPNVKQLDPETLEPIGLARQENLHPDLKGPMSAAHARIDPVTGDLFNFNLEFGASAVYRVFQVSAETGKTSILATLKGSGVHAVYIHSLLLTPDYVVLCLWGSHLRNKGLSVIWELNVLDAIEPTDPAKPTKWFVIDRRHGNGLVAEFESPAFFCFHTVNAWQDENSDIMAEVTEYSSSEVLHKFYYEAMISTSSEAHALAQKNMPWAQPHLTRYRLSAKHISAKPFHHSQKGLPKAEEVLRISGGELPTINPAYSLKPHRYVYSVSDRGLSTFFDGLAKIDAKTGETLYWENGTGHTPSEAIFVADPEGKEEDDGVLLSVVLDGVKRSSYLLVLDARTMKEDGRAEVEGAVGFGFHGAFCGSGGR